MNDFDSAPAPISPRALRWRLARRTLHFPRRPLVMGILNITPDSFSDGGRYFDPAAAIAQAQRLTAAGADILDIGGESTRPGSEPISVDEELRRVLPLFEALSHDWPAPLSIDTSKSAVAEAALAAGAEIVNDVTGLAGDPRMLEVVARANAGACVMHMQGTPQTMQNDPRYADVVAEVFAWLRSRRDALSAAGIEPERVALDPGIGFGKTHAHNLALLRHCARFHDLGCPLLVGHSRKGFIGKVLGNKEANRDIGSLGVTLALAQQGVQVVRVHDVAATREALALFEAAGGFEPTPH